MNRDESEPVKSKGDARFLWIILALIAVTAALLLRMLSR